VCDPIWQVTLRSSETDFLGSYGPTHPITPNVLRTPNDDVRLAG